VQIQESLTFMVPTKFRGEGEWLVARGLPTPAVVIRPKLPAYVGSSGSHLVRPLSTIVQ